jgi:hypothetical protein
MTLPGLRPAAFEAPVAIILYYLNRDFVQYRGIACAMSPPWGQGWRKGGLLLEPEVRG